MKITLREAANYLLNNDNFLLLCHVSPDGDTVGSACALARGLISKGKSVRILCGDRFTQEYAFMLDGIKMSEGEPEHIVAVDVAVPKLLGEEYEGLFGDKVELCIDHHSTNNLYAEKVYLESDSASAAEIVYLILKKMDVEITPIIASCLYCGVSTDTGCFRFSNTTVRTFEIAAELAKAGADYYNINQAFFETKTRTYAALERLALESMKFYFNEQCAIITITQEMYARTGSDESEVTKLANLPRQVEGVRVGVMMRELKDGGFKCSIRTHGEIDASQIAGRLGGGGHAGAAACTVNTTKGKATNLLLKEIQAELEAFNGEKK